MTDTTDDEDGFWVHSSEGYLTVQRDTNAPTDMVWVYAMNARTWINDEFDIVQLYVCYPDEVQMGGGKPPTRESLCDQIEFSQLPKDVQREFLSQVNHLKRVVEQMAFEAEGDNE